MKRNYDLKYPLATAVVIGATLFITGCDKQTSTGETVGQRVDKAIDKTNETAHKAGDKIEEAAKSTAESVKQKAGEVGTVIEDSAITAAVKAELIKDPGVSALKIDVNTVKGEVTLNGEADSDAARTRAGQIAAAVTGVVKVNNVLSVKAKG